MGRLRTRALHYGAPGSTKVLGPFVAVIMVASKNAPKILSAQTAVGGDRHGDTPNATSPVPSSDRIPGGASKAAASDRRTGGKQIQGRFCPPETRRAQSRLCLAP